ncbi:MAG: hypothetical protein KC731_42960 [Myxococcales bacterium]|nr:hypothetical protein [Myxococcales bacterium]
MTHLLQRRTLLVLLLALLATACGPREKLFAAPTNVGGVLVSVYDAKVKRHQLWVKMNVENVLDVPVVIDRDLMAVRLPGGEMLPRASGVTTQHKPYVLNPGERRQVHVDFRSPDHDLTTVGTTTLVITGVRVEGTAEPLATGEIALGRSPQPVHHAKTTQPAKPRSVPKAETSTLPEPRPEARQRMVAVDLRALDARNFEALDGTRLEQAMVVRLVQDGFAVVSPEEAQADPSISVVAVRVDDEGQVVLERALGRDILRRETAANGVPLEELHLELAQKASDLASLSISQASKD